MRVPEELSLVGFDDITMAGWESFRLTTVRQPIGEMAEQATRLLLEQMDGEGRMRAMRVIFPPSLVRRASA